MWLLHATDYPDSSFVCGECDFVFILQLMLKIERKHLDELKKKFTIFLIPPPLLILGCESEHFWCFSDPLYAEMICA